MGYAKEFVIGMMANVMAEGEAGEFEKAIYDRNPEQEPDYMQAVKKRHNYASLYGGKNIQQIGIRETKNLIEDIIEQNDNYKDDKDKAKFGLGCVQWTDLTRSSNLIKCYKQVCGLRNYPTFKHCIRAELLQMLNELEQGDFDNLYANWEARSTDLDDLGKTKKAANIIFRQYERASSPDPIPRENNAEKLFRILGE